LQRKREAILLFLILLPGLAQAGDWHTYTNTNYLNDLKVVGSRVWWGTTGGVVKYDNSDSSYTIYRNTEGLGGIDVRAVEVDEEGNLWFGLAGGVINRLRPNGQWRRASLEYGINCLIYHKPYMWAGTEQALIEFDPQTWLPREICEQPGTGLQRDRPIRCLWFQGDTLWAGTEGGISYIDIAHTENLRDPAQWTLLTRENSGLSSDTVNTITSYRHEVYAGTDKGICRFSNGSWHAVGGGWQDGIIYDLKAYSGKLLAVTAKGVWRWDGANLDSLKCPSSVPRKLSVGPQGELWVGTWGEGTLLYSGGGWQYPFKTQGPIGNRIADMALDDAGNLWLASPGYGMSGFDGKRWENFSPIPDPTRDTESCSHLEPQMPWGVCAVAADRIGNKWFGLWPGGVIKLDPEGNQTLYDEDNSILRWSDPEYRDCIWNVVVNQIMVDKANNKYFANWYNGVAILDSSETNWVMYDRLISSRITGRLILDMLIDNQGGKWFAHRDGVGNSKGGVSYLVDDGGTPLEQGDDSLVYFLGESDGLLNNKVNCLAIDIDGSIWVGTDEGVSKYDPWLSKVFVPGYRFLPDYYGEIGRQEVRAIAVDPQGNKWFATSDGLFKFWYEREEYHWHRYTPETSGLLDERINCLLLDKTQGHLWIGTDKGLSMLELGMVKPKPALSQLMVYPNPLLLFSSGSAAVKFKNLTATSIVDIFAVSGELIREIPSKGLGMVSWDGRNRGGNLVASGVYLWVVRDAEGNKSRGKIAVIR